MSDYPPPPDDAEAFKARRKSRNLVMGLALGFMAILFFAVAMVRMGQGG